MTPAEPGPSVSAPQVRPLAAVPRDGTDAPGVCDDAAVEKLFYELKDKLHAARPDADLTIIDKAYALASRAHSDQKRDSGAPYMVHPLQVAHILADMQMDLICIATGLLHDAVEDCKEKCVTTETVREQFGEEVARCVDGVTKLDKLQMYSREDRQAETIRKMLLAMVADIRVILVKLADRLHNMRTLGGIQDRERQLRIAQETIDIYAPIAHRLGMGKMRGELEDLAFRYQEPEEAAQLEGEIEAKRPEYEAFLKQIQHTVEVNLAREGIPARVDGRVKRIYSVYQKLKRQKIGLEQVYDLLALRIVTDSVKNCYAALGVIHNEWHPIPGRIKDFIAIPRPNMYQSLHTSVMGPHGRAFEVQIRTEEMHRLAEEGIAAHWKYKEGRRGVSHDDQRMQWLRQAVEWQRDMRNPADFLSTLKVDLYETDEVFTFTPAGKVIALPRGATPIDFAYAIHSDVGSTCVGAKVNGRIVPLRYALKNGDRVEILRQPGHVPSRDWLALVKTSRARNKIRHVINATERVKAIEIGQKYLEKEARRLGVQLGKITKADLEKVATEYGYGRVEDLYAALGYGRFSPRQVLQKIAPEQVREPVEAKPAPAPEAPPQPPPGEGDLVIRVSGIDDLLVYRAKCCNPIKGDPIVGYVTRGKGVAVHSRNCTNVQSLMYEPDRRIEVEWTRAGTRTFPVKLTIYTEDQPGMLAQLTSVVSSDQSNIRSLEARSDDKRNGDGAVIEMTVEIKDKKQLDRVVSAMRRISGVRDVERTQ